jgi:predicted nucleic acid-binding protein
MALRVIVNVSPLIGLAKAGRLRLLGALYDEVLIPPAVYEDVVIKGRRRIGARAVKNAVQTGWIKVVRS